jgi:hypothetical protein
MSEFARTRSATVGPWLRPLAISDDIDDPRLEKADGVVELPSWRWGGPPRRDNLEDRCDRALVYEQVLTQGTDDDVRYFVVLDDLLRPGTSQQTGQALPSLDLYRRSRLGAEPRSASTQD